MDSTLGNSKRVIKMVLGNLDGKMDQHTVVITMKEIDRGKDNISTFEVRQFRRDNGKTGF